MLRKFRHSSTEDEFFFCEKTHLSIEPDTWSSSGSSHLRLIFSPSHRGCCIYSTLSRKWWCSWWRALGKLYVFFYETLSDDASTPTSRSRWTWNYFEVGTSNRMTALLIIHFVSHAKLKSSKRKLSPQKFIPKRVWELFGASHPRLLHLIKSYWHSTVISAGEYFHKKFFKPIR